MATPRFSDPFHLSEEGSDRGTAYTMGNKSVTLGDKTHVVWTDRIARTQAKTYDHTTKSWSPTLFVGDGVDNHNNPCLTADAQGRLHLAYGPHGKWADYPDHFPNTCYRYAVSPQPNSFDGIDKSLAHRGTTFGYHATYASMTHCKQGFDCIVYRGGEHPPSLLFQRQRELGGWTKAIELMEQDIVPGYTHYAGQIAADTLGRLYVGGHFYSAERTYSLGVAMLRSGDLGKTWTDLHGERADLPIRWSPRYSVPAADAVHDPRLGGMAIDSKHRLWALTGSARLTDPRATLSCFEDKRWRTIELGKLLPPGRVPALGTFTIDHKDRIHVVVDAASASIAANDKAMSWWGHTCLEVFYFFSDDDGKTFSCHHLTDNDPDNANWLATISKPGPYHPVTKPIILWTKGKAVKNEKEGCASTTRTDIFCRFVEVD